MSKQFVQKSFDLVLLINNYYFEELPIKYMHKMFSVLLDLYESLKQFSRDSTESSVVKITIGDLNSKCSTLLAHILRNRPSLHLPNSILKTLQIY